MAGPGHPARRSTHHLPKGATVAESLTMERRTEIADMMMAAELNKCPDCCLVPTCDACGPCEHDDDDEIEAVQAWLIGQATVEIGVVDGSALPADEHGWSRESVAYGFGDAPGGDEAITQAWTAYYVGPENQRRDVSYYVYGDPSREYGVVEYVESWTATDDGDRDENADEIPDESEGMAPSFTTPAEALDYARRMAMSDDRWWFSLGHAV
jgi:hypothetical protein